MADLSRDAQRLSDALLELDSDEAMLLEEFEGYAAAVIICPEVIPSSEWLPVIWGRSMNDPAPVFDDLAHANRVLDLVMRRYNAIATALFEAPERYDPVFAYEAPFDQAIWELWIGGFEKAMKLRPSAWHPLLTASAEAAKAWRGLMKLVEGARLDSTLTDAQIEAIGRSAPDDIREWVITINEWRLARAEPLAAAPPPPSWPVGKVRRNDPCPCGSGKKYKKCCGLN